MGDKPKLLEQKDAINLLSIGRTQKETANLLNVSEKTIGEWVKKWRKEDAQTKRIIANLKNLLEGLSTDKEASKHEIMYLSASIKRLQETLIIKPFKANELPKKRNRSI